MATSPCSRAIRRVRDRISVGDNDGVSSINSGRSFNLLTALVSFGQSSSSSLPVNTLPNGIRPIAEIIRMIIALAGISILKTMTGLSLLSTACSTRFTAKAVFPIEGLAATMIKSDRCKPEVFSSSSVKPVLIPVRVLSELNSSSMRSTAPFNRGFTA